MMPEIPSLKKAIEILHLGSDLKTPYSRNVGPLLESTPALLPMLAGTEYRINGLSTECDFLMCFQTCDLKSLSRALMLRRQNSDRLIAQIVNACNLCCENLRVVSMFDHIWFECDAEPSNSLSIFLGTDYNGNLCVSQKELLKVATALDLLESLYSVTEGRQRVYGVANSIIQELGGCAICEVGFMGRAGEEAHVKLLMASDDSISKEVFLERCRRLSQELDVVLSKTYVSGFLETILSYDCAIHLSASIYAKKQKYALEFKPAYDPDQAERYCSFWNTIRDVLKIRTDADWMNTAFAAAQPHNNVVRVSSRLHHIKLFAEDTGELGIKVYRDLRTEPSFLS
jgi:hypothetical protein